MKRMVVFILLLPVCLYAQKGISIHGYLKSFFINLHAPESLLIGTASERQNLGLVNQRLRLESTASLSKTLSLNAAYDLNMRVQDPLLSQRSLLTLGTNPTTYRFSDPKDQLYPESEQNTSFALLQNLDRLALTARLPFADFIVGRQAIAWGSARVINPTDILAPFTFDELDKEERRGIDAVRVRIPIGLYGEFDTGFVFGRDFESHKNAWYGRLKTYLWNTDISVLGIGFQNHILAGMNLARALGGAGVWLEVAQVWPHAYGAEAESDADTYLRLSVGADYAFGSKTYGFMEFHLSTAGAGDPQTYAGLLSSMPFQEGAVYLLGRHYLAPGINVQITPLITLTGQILWNLDDLSLYFAPVAEYNIAQNIYLQAGAYMGTGAEPQTFTLESEFGTYPDSYYTSFRIYF
jgi:hypothetical protein